MATVLLWPSGAIAVRGEIPHGYGTHHELKEIDYDYERDVDYGYEDYGKSSHGRRTHHGTKNETQCENNKLGASADYYKCLIKVIRKANKRGLETSEDALAVCDDRFARAIDRADADETCRTTDGPAVLGDPIKGVALATSEIISATTTQDGSGSGNLGGCEAINLSAGFATCTVDTGNTSIDLAEVIDAMTSLNIDVDSNTVLYIQAWGGNGGHGNTSNGGAGGEGGYAQSTTTAATFESTYQTASFFYFLGTAGTFAANSGGDGGTATIVTINDLSIDQPNFADTILVAAGGGGGGAGRGTNACTTGWGSEPVLGAGGGNGGVAIAGTTEEASGPGSKGGERRNENFSGSGGGDGMGGAVNGRDSDELSEPATIGNNGVAPIGGQGGNHTTPQTGFTNSSTVASANNGGRGGFGENDAGGGGGGGGWGSGGGGAGNLAGGFTNCETGGGGGGGSLAVQSTATCSNAPTFKPVNPNPNGSSLGYVQITFDLGGC